MTPQEIYTINLFRSWRVPKMYWGSSVTDLPPGVLEALVSARALESAKKGSIPRPGYGLCGNGDLPAALAAMLRVQVMKNLEQRPEMLTDTINRGARWLWID